MGKLYRRGRTYYGDYINFRTKQRIQTSLRTADERVAKMRLRDLELRVSEPDQPPMHMAEILVSALNSLAMDDQDTVTIKTDETRPDGTCVVTMITLTRRKTQMPPTRTR